MSLLSTIQEINGQLTALETCINSSSMPPLEMAEQVTSLEKIHYTLKTLGEEITNGITLATKNARIWEVNTLSDLQKTYNATQQIFERVFQTCVSQKIHLLMQEIEESKILKDPNARESKLYPLFYTINLLLNDPLYSGERKRLAEYLDVLKSELQKIQEGRTHKAQLLSDCQKIREAITEKTTLEDLEKILSPELKQALAPLLFAEHAAEVEAYSHLDVLNGRFSVDQIASSLDCLILGPKKEMPHTPILTTKRENFDMGKTILELPDEILLRFFQAFEEHKDFVSLLKTCKRFYELSKDPKALNCLPPGKSIPSFLANSSDPDIQKLSPIQKLRLAERIEKRFLLKEEFPLSFRIELPCEEARTLPKRIFRNYLALAIPSAAKGSVLIHNFKTKKEYTFQAHQSPVTYLDILTRKDRLLLVTAGESEGFKIWDFEEQSNLILHHSASNIMVSYKDSLFYGSPIICTHEELLYVAYTDCIAIWDCNQSLTTTPSLTIPVSYARQIGFTETHLLVVSEKNWSIWNISDIKKKLKDSALDISIPPHQGSLKLGSYSYLSQGYILAIRTAAIFKHYLFIAYTQGYVLGERFIIGEIRNWQTDEEIRKLSYECNLKGTQTLDFVEFEDHLAITSSALPTIWDMKATSHLEQTTNYKFWENRFLKHYILGEHILYPHKKGICIFKKTALSLTSKTNNVEKSLINSFDLYGRYLLIETESSAEDKKNVYAFDLDPNM